MKRLVLILFIFQLMCAYSHPVHVTVINIEPNAQKAVFEVSCKIFTDDLEQAVLQHTGVNVRLTQNNPIQNINELLHKYVTSKFSIIINDKNIPPQKIKLVNYSIVNDATWIYLEFPITNKIKTLAIQNDLLNHLHPDMTNLVIINWGNQQQGLTFTKHQTKLAVQ